MHADIPPPASPSSHPPADLRLGTCAWSFKDWQGVFYPEQLPDAQRLAVYAKSFDAVEVDSTFYGALSAKAAAHWLGATPPGFAFACKMIRTITHDQRLRGCEALLTEFLAGMEPLRPKLACILIQLPPYFQLRRDELALKEFVRHLPSEFRFAIEFRDPAWHVPRIAHLLEEHSVCWAWNDITALDHRNEAAFTFLPRTTDFLYVRLMGDLATKYSVGGGKHVYDRLSWARDAAIENWAVKILQQGEAVEKAYIFANNHFEGFAPETCRRLAAKLGIELNLPERRSAAAGRVQQQLELGF